IRGRDPTGQALYIHPRYLSRGLRAQARRLATELLGPPGVQERQNGQQQAKALEQVMAAHVRDAKKEDGMDDPSHRERPDDPRTRYRVTWADGTQRTLTPAQLEEALRDEAATPSQDRNAIIRVDYLTPISSADRLAALKARMAQLARGREEERDRGLGL